MNISDFYNQISSSVKTTTPQVAPISGIFNRPSATTTPAYKIKDRNVQITEKDLDAMRPLLYGEISNRTPDKQELESHVIMNTALNRLKEYNARGQKKTLSDVVAMPNQYQAYGGPQYTNYFNPPDPVALAKKQQVDMIVDRIRDKIKKGEFVDNTEGAYYYVHEKDGKIKYDNLRKLFAK
jgi:hypothetical protein